MARGRAVAIVPEAGEKSRLPQPWGVPLPLAAAGRRFSFTPNVRRAGRDGAPLCYERGACGRCCRTTVIDVDRGVTAGSRAGQLNRARPALLGVFQGQDAHKPTTIPGRCHLRPFA